MKIQCKASDYYETPNDLFDELDKEFNFEWDACATGNNSKIGGCYFSEEDNSLTQDWSRTATRFWCNPPYSKEGNKDAFIAKAAEQQRKGVLTVMIIPTKTNTKAFHKYIWDKNIHAPQPGIQIRYPEGRPVFWLNGEKCAHSGRNDIMIVVFYPLETP